MEIERARRYWNGEATTFDQEADHGLTHPRVAAAWDVLLADLLPAPPADLLDAGCGTGSLSVLLALNGYRVTGIDFAPEMLAQAEAKATARGADAIFLPMDAAAPVLPASSFDVVICRHVLWALPAWPTVLDRWASLLRPGGRLVLIEGFWHTGGGLKAEEILSGMSPEFANVTVRNLSGQPDLWGGPVNDERYAVVVSRHSDSGAGTRGAAVGRM
ncbi:MAG: methyltransferase domain-containing protein [Caldilineaceae bacterium]|nr:methyltransferase domain-containing protein [Caldilineaceae bacterium]